MKENKRISSLLLAIFFILFAGPVYSADMFLDTCLKIAEARSKKLSVASEQVKLAETRVFNSARQFFPALSFERKYTRGSTTQADYQSEQIGLNASQPLYQGGKLVASYKHDSMLTLASRYNYTKTREELFASIKLAYYEQLSGKMQMRALGNALQDVEKLQQKVLAEYHAKAISELDVLESENFRDKIRDMVDNTKDDIALSEKKLILLMNIEKISDIPVPMPEELFQDLPEISFTLDECINLAKVNNLDIISNQLAIKIAYQRKKIIRARVIPNLSVQGSYGQGAEAFITQPLDLQTTWTVMGKLDWGLWGNSLEVTQDNESTNPTTATDPTAMVTSVNSDIKLSFLDDINYFIQDKETNVGYNQAASDLLDATNKTIADVQKNYNDYSSSLRDSRTYRNEITMRKRKLALMRKRNDLYEIPTVQLMEESWKYAEAISSYAKALFKNYASVTELERMTLIPLR